MRAWISLLGVLVLLLSGCGTTTTDTGPTSPAVAVPSPGTVHTAWVAALRVGDRTGAAPLVGTTGAAADPNFLDQTLTTMRGMVDPTMSPGGLTALDDRGIAVDGGDRLGLSFWTFATTTRCYQTRMREEAGQWRVVGWNERPMTACEE